MIAALFACVFLQGIINDRNSRITELEEALRESIKITAQREVVMHEQQMKLEHTERMVTSLVVVNICKAYLYLYTCFLNFFCGFCAFESEIMEAASTSEL